MNVFRVWYKEGIIPPATEIQDNLGPIRSQHDAVVRARANGDGLYLVRRPDGSIRYEIVIENGVLQFMRTIN